MRPRPWMLLALERKGVLYKTQQDGLSWVIVRENEWRIEIFTRDHPPPHVHVRCADGRVKVSIPPPGGTVSVLAVHGLSTVQAMRAVRLVETHRALLRAAWSLIHE